MHRYKIEFLANPIDEYKIQALIERSADITGFAIHRESLQRPSTESKKTGSKSRLELEILALMSDRRLWRRKFLVKHFQPTHSIVKIDRTLAKLVKRDLIRKPKHGIYSSLDSGDPDESEIPPLRGKQLSGSRPRLLEMLKEPMSIRELAVKLNVSKQRVSQLLSTPVKSGIVKRFCFHNGLTRTNLYACATFDEKSFVFRQHSMLNQTEQAILSVLSDRTLSCDSDVAEHAKVPRYKIANHIYSLQKKGLISIFRVGLHLFVRITQSGTQHPQYSKESPKALDAKFQNELGRIRCLFIKALAILKSARAIDLTKCLRSKCIDGHEKKTGQIIRLLCAAGIFQKIKADEGRHSRYRLTRKGCVIAEALQNNAVRAGLGNLNSLISGFSA